MPKLAENMDEVVALVEHWNTTGLVIEVPNYGMMGLEATNWIANETGGVLVWQVLGTDDDAGQHETEWNTLMLSQSGVGLYDASDWIVAWLGPAGESNMNEAGVARVRSGTVARNKRMVDAEYWDALTAIMAR
jgi:hypothetical protein